MNDRGWNTDERCPHCKQRISDLWEYLSIDEEDTQFDCPHCERVIIGNVHIEYVLQRPRQ